MKTQIETIPATKAAIIAALRAFVSQRSGIDFSNYGERSAFMGDYRPILRAGREARELLRAVEWRDSITAEDIIDASRRAFSGRLTFSGRGKRTFCAHCNAIVNHDGHNTTCPKCIRQDGVRHEHAEWAVSYVTGQYFPTEYRNAACAVLAAALWANWREHSMPMPDGADSDGSPTYGGRSAGEWLRRKARTEFGRGIASRWFN